jgi:hypothetical protein
MHQHFNLLKPTGNVMHQQFNLLKPTGYVMHQQFNLIKSTGYVMHQQFKIPLVKVAYIVFKTYFLADNFEVSANGLCPQIQFMCVVANGRHFTNDEPEWFLQERQCTYNVTFRRARVTTLVEK